MADWECIGQEIPAVNDTNKVPSWLLETKLGNPVGDTTIYHIKGRTFKYKIVRSGQGRNYFYYYRKRWHKKH